MTLLCYHASHEQFAPSRLLKLAVAAEHAGFTGLHSSDHFQPWSVRQGHSGFSFSWVAAALQATSLPCSMVCAPGQRYHPAIVAQAIATLAEMFPGRYSVELGTGEALNEVITGDGWPAKDVRQERLLQSVQVIRRLLAGEEVSCKGLVTVKNARLWTLPTEPPLLFGAALSDETAHWVGRWADGLLTGVGKDISALQTRIQAFRRGGGEGKPVRLQYSFSYARSRQVAIDEAWEQWKGPVQAPEHSANMATPEEFDRISQHTTRDQLLENTDIFTDMYALRAQVARLAEMGASQIILHNLNRQQEQFIEDFSSTGKM